METLFAWTAPGSNYPAYLNISRDGDQVIVTVRAEAWMDNDGLNVGQTITIRTPADAFKETGLLPPSPAPAPTPQEPTMADEYTVQSHRRASDPPDVGKRYHFRKVVSPTPQAAVTEEIARCLCRYYLNGGDPNQSAMRWDRDTHSMQEQEFPAWQDYVNEANALLSQFVVLRKPQKGA